MAIKSNEQMKGTVVIGKTTIDDKTNVRFTNLRDIEVTKVVRREPLKFRTEDLKMFVLGARLGDNDYDHFCCPGEMWWTNGVDGQEWFSQTYRLFKSVENIQEGINKDFFLPANTSELNIYSLSLINGEISLNFETSVVRSS